MFSDFVQVVRHWADQRGDATAFVFLEHGEREGARLSFSALAQRAKTLAAALQELGLQGGRLLLMYPPGLDFIEAFLGCHFAGIVPVPVHPPSSREDGGLRMAQILDDCGAAGVLTCENQHASVERALTIVRPTDCPPVWSSDRLEANPNAWREPALGAEHLALLQYTSGSTGQPKGVRVSHGNLLANQAMIRDGFGHDKTTVVAGWLPLFHDMGLIGNVLQPLFLGVPCYLMPPMAFIQKPVRWLQAIARYRATTSGAPNFAYDQCVQRIRPEQREGLDLSSWRVAYNGSEPVRAATLARFIETYAPYGFAPQACYPCYGMAEATLFVSGGRCFEGAVQLIVDEEALAANRVVPSAEGLGRTLVASGRVSTGLIVVDPEQRTALGSDRVGEIWIAGPHVAGGYHGKPELNARAFEARTDEGEGPFLRSGDLGFIHEGRLFVTGRLKDLIIIKGRNHYPQDLEQTVCAAEPELRLGQVAAFAVEQEDEERLVLVVEIKLRPQEPFDAEAVTAHMREALSAHHGVRAHAIALVPPGSVPLTSSGKVRRAECRARWLAGSLVELGQ